MTNLGSKTERAVVFGTAIGGLCSRSSFLGARASLPTASSAISTLWHALISHAGRLRGDFSQNTTKCSLEEVSTEFVTDTVTLSLYSGSLKLNEIAFYDLDGKQIPLTVVGAMGTQGNLFDEQDTVADPSYYTGMYFDELYHARTAYENLYNLSPYENSHPPLGKILLMLGVWAFGMTPFGWRVVGALFALGCCRFSMRLASGSSKTPTMR
jgi:hypothetical protein